MSSGNRIIFALILGIFLGYFFAFIQFSSAQEVCDCHERSNQDAHLKVQYDTQNVERGLNFSLKTQQHVVENKSVAQNLFDQVRVLCWIMTDPDNHKTKAIHVKRTWGSRCNKILFMSSENDTELESIALPVIEGRDNLWAKTKAAFKYIYKHHLNDADWFLKADDDTYVVVENLRFLLYEYSPEMPIYFGCKFNRSIKQGYNSGGAGYVLSKKAVVMLIEEGIPNTKKCRNYGAGNEDVELGKCLENVGVLAGDSRDSSLKGRFFGIKPEKQVYPGIRDESFWYWQYQYYPIKTGPDCCSDFTISFHYIVPRQMYVMDFLIYHLQPYGIPRNNESLPKKLDFKEVVDRIDKYSI